MATVELQLQRAAGARPHRPAGRRRRRPALRASTRPSSTRSGWRSARPARAPSHLHRRHCPDRPVLVTLVDDARRLPGRGHRRGARRARRREGFGALADVADLVDAEAVPPGVGLAVISRPGRRRGGRARPRRRRRRPDDLAHRGLSRPRRLRVPPRFASGGWLLRRLRPRRVHPRPYACRRAAGVRPRGIRPRARSRRPRPPPRRAVAPTSRRTHVGAHPCRQR